MQLFKWSYQYHIMIIICSSLRVYAWSGVFFSSMEIYSWNYNNSKAINKRFLLYLLYMLLLHMYNTACFTKELPNLGAATKNHLNLYVQ